MDKDSHLTFGLLRYLSALLSLFLIFLFKISMAIEKSIS